MILQHILSVVTDTSHTAGKIWPGFINLREPVDVVCSNKLLRRKFCNHFSLKFISRIEIRKLRMNLVVLRIIVNIFSKICEC